MTLIERDDEIARLRELEREVLQHDQAGAFARLWRKASRDRDEARQQLAGAVGGFERVAFLAEWLQRDRREPDKVLAYAQELANLATAHGGSRS